jgi:hypothetical protein
MYINKELENSPLFYYFVGMAVVMGTIYGVITLFIGNGEQGVFILTISVLFYVAIYHRLFKEDSHIE